MRGFLAGIADDLADRVLDRAAHDGDALGLVFVVAGQVLQRLGGIEQGGAAARNDAFLDRGLGGVQRVVDAVLALLDLDFGRAADADHRNAAGELRQAFLQLFLVVVGGGLFDLRLDLGDAGLDVGLLAGAVDDGGVVLVDLDRSWRVPSMSSFTFSSLMPRSSLMTWPPVTMAMSSSMALRRSPKPGALTAATFRPPRSLLTTRVARASPSISSAMISSGRPALHHRFQDRQHRLQAGELLFVDQDVGRRSARRPSCRRW